MAECFFIIMMLRVAADTPPALPAPLAMLATNQMALDKNCRSSAEDPAGFGK